MQTHESISRKIFSEDVIVISFLSAVPLWTYVFLPLWSNSKGHTMSAGNSWTDVATAISGIVSAVVAAVAAGAAVYAAKLAKEASDSWRRGLEYQRIDEAISAVHEVHSRINGVLATMEASGQDVWDAYDDAWDGWSRFDQAYAVVRRYHGSLSDRADERLPSFWPN